MLYKINSTLGNLATSFKIVIPGGKLDTFLNTSHGDIVKVVDIYVKHALTSVEASIRRTALLSNIYIATYTRICSHIIYPFNDGLNIFFLLHVLFAKLFGLGWCLLLLLLSVTLVIHELGEVLIRNKPIPLIGGRGTECKCFHNPHTQYLYIFSRKIPYKWTGTGKYEHHLPFKNRLQGL